MPTLPNDTLFDPAVMTADIYNRIREFTPELPFGKKTVEKVGAIIRRHSLEKQVGVLYVHRHFNMPADSIALEETPSNDIRVTRMTRLSKIDPSDSEIGGISFKLMETGKFQAFEYSARSKTPTFPHAFLEELAHFITENELTDVLGISVRGTVDGLRNSELNLFDPKISVNLPTEDIPADLRENATPTNWVYMENMERNGNAIDDFTRQSGWQSWSQCTYMCPDSKCTYMCKRECTWMCRGGSSELSLKAIIDGAFQKRGLVF
jgi:hypothetical protein